MIACCRRRTASVIGEPRLAKLAEKLAEDLVVLDGPFVAPPAPGLLPWNTCEAVRPEGHISGGLFPARRVPLARRREDLRPQNAQVALRRNHERDAHLPELRPHEVRAMPGAVEPRRHDGLGVRLARRHVLSDGAPTVSGASHTLGGLAAVGTAVAHVIVGGHVGGVRSGGLRQSRGQRERMGCAEPLPAATAVLLARRR